MEDLLNMGGDIVSKIPGPQQIMDWIGQGLQILLLAGPVMMVVMGLLYCFAAPREANHHFGFRCYYGMGSVEAWRYTQKVAGITWISLGLVLLVAVLIVRLQFATLDPMELLVWAVACAVVQAVALMLAGLLVRILAFCRFDRNGTRRSEKRKHRRGKHPKYL